MTVQVTTGVSASSQESAFMNATMQTLDDGSTMSISVDLPSDWAIRRGIDVNDEHAIANALETIFASALDEGCRIECQIGKSD